MVEIEKMPFKFKLPLNLAGFYIPEGPPEGIDGFAVSRVEAVLIVPNEFLAIY